LLARGVVLREEAGEVLRRLSQGTTMLFRHGRKNISPPGHSKMSLTTKRSRPRHIWGDQGLSGQKVSHDEGEPCVLVRAIRRGNSV
jgi:hypothetical protein